MFFFVGLILLVGVCCLILFVFFFFVGFVVFLVFGGGFGLVELVGFIDWAGSVCWFGWLLRSFAYIGWLKPFRFHLHFRRVYPPNNTYLSNTFLQGTSTLPSRVFCFSICALVLALLSLVL